MRYRPENYSRYGGWAFTHVYKFNVLQLYQGDLMKVYKSVSIDYETPVSKAISLIKKEKLPIVVVKNGKYYGLLDARQIREYKIVNPKLTHSGSVAQRAPRLRKDMDIMEIVEAFFMSRFPALAVVDDEDRVVGMMMRWDLLKELIAKNLIPKKKVSEVMSSPVISINEKETVGRALGTMREFGVRRLAVVDDKGKISGIISMFDIGLLMAQPRERLPQLKEKHSIYEILVESIMTTNVYSVQPSKLLTEAATIMLENQIPSLVVLSRKKPVGIISSRDILEQVLKREEQPNIFVSGLDKYDKPYYEDIIKTAKRVIDKINKSKYMTVDYLTLHVKKQGHRYAVYARISINNTIIPVNINSFGWGLMEAINTTMDEIEKIVKKRKKELEDLRKRVPIEEE